MNYGKRLKKIPDTMSLDNNEAEELLDMIPKIESQPYAEQGLDDEKIRVSEPELDSINKCITNCRECPFFTQSLFEENNFEQRIIACRLNPDDEFISKTNDDVSQLEAQCQLKKKRFIFTHTDFKESEQKQDKEKPVKQDCYHDNPYGLHKLMTSYELQYFLLIFQHRQPSRKYELMNYFLLGRNYTVFVSETEHRIINSILSNPLENNLQGSTDPLNELPGSHMPGKNYTQWTTPAITYYDYSKPQNNDNTIDPL